MQSNLAETKQKLSTFLGKEIDFIAGLGINFSVGKVLLGWCCGGIREKSQDLRS